MSCPRTGGGARTKNRGILRTLREPFALVGVADLTRQLSLAVRGLRWRQLFRAGMVALRAAYCCLRRQISQQRGIVMRRERSVQTKVSDAIKAAPPIPKLNGHAEPGTLPP